MSRRRVTMSTNEAAELLDTTASWFIKLANKCGIKGRVLKNSHGQDARYWTRAQVEKLREYRERNLPGRNKKDAMDCGPAIGHAAADRRTRTYSVAEIFPKEQGW